MRACASGLFSGLQRSFFHSVGRERTAFSGLKRAIRLGVVIGINYFTLRCRVEYSTTPSAGFQANAL